MGLFDNLASAVGSALGQSGSEGETGAQNILGNLLQQGGIGQSGSIVGQLLGSLTGGQGAAGQSGISGVLETLAANGLGSQVSSWLSNNPNLPITVDQLRDALGSDQAQQLAQQSGLPVGEFLKHLAEHLPQAASEAAGTPST
jgi:uncharacterized protein YidB (DUF937 family)